MTYWQYKYYEDITTAAPSPDVEGFWDSRGYMQTNKVAVLSMPYAYAFCDLPLATDFNFDSQEFSLELQSLGK